MVVRTGTVQGSAVSTRHLSQRVRQHPGCRGTGEVNLGLVLTRKGGNCDAL